MTYRLSQTHSQISSRLFAHGSQMQWSNRSKSDHRYRLAKMRSRNCSSVRLRLKLNCKPSGFSRTSPRAKTSPMSASACWHQLNWPHVLKGSHAIRFHNPKALLRSPMTTYDTLRRKVITGSGPTCLRLDPRYSYRNATDGSTLIAFRAGK